MQQLSDATRTAKRLGVRLSRVICRSAGIALLGCFAATLSTQAPSPIPDAVPMAERLNHWAWQPLRQVTPPVPNLGSGAPGSAGVRAIDLKQHESVHARAERTTHLRVRV